MERMETTVSNQVAMTLFPQRIISSVEVAPNAECRLPALGLLLIFFLKGTDSLRLEIMFTDPLCVTGLQLQP